MDMALENVNPASPNLYIKWPKPTRLTTSLSQNPTGATATQMFKWLKSVG